MCLCIRGPLWCFWGPHRCLSLMWGPFSLSGSTITIPTQTELINSIFNLTCARVPVPLLNQFLCVFMFGENVRSCECVKFYSLPFQRISKMSFQKWVPCHWTCLGMWIATETFCRLNSTQKDGKPEKVWFDFSIWVESLNICSKRIRIL